MTYARLILACALVGAFALLQASVRARRASRELADRRARARG